MWQKINNFVRTHTILSVFLLLVIFLLLTMVTGLLFITGDIVEEAVGMQIFIVSQFTLSVICIFLMKKLEVFDETDLKFINIGKGFLLSWVMLLLAAVQFISGIFSPPEGGFLTPTPLYLITVILYPFIVSGLFEEVLFRGLVLKILLKKTGETKKGIFSAFAISAALFGVAHSVNLLWDEPLAVFSTVVFATGGGFFLGAIYLRTKTLIVPVLLHGLFNLSGMIWWAFTSEGPASASATTLADFAVTFLIAVLPLTIASYVLLRKVDLKVIAEK